MNRVLFGHFNVRLGERGSIVQTRGKGIIARTVSKLEEDSETTTKEGRLGQASGNTEMRREFK